MEEDKEHFMRYYRHLQQTKPANSISFTELVELTIGTFSHNLHTPSRFGPMKFIHEIVMSKNIVNAPFNTLRFIDEELRSFESSKILINSFFKNFIQYAFWDMSEIKPEQARYYIPFLAMYSIRIGNVSHVLDLVEQLGLNSHTDPRAHNSSYIFDLHPLIKRIIFAYCSVFDNNLLNLLCEFYQHFNENMKHHIIHLLISKSYCPELFDIDENQSISFLNKLIMIKSFANDFRLFLNDRNEYKFRALFVIINKGSAMFLRSLLNHKLIESNDFHFVVEVQLTGKLGNNFLRAFSTSNIHSLEED